MTRKDFYTIIKEMGLTVSVAFNGNGHVAHVRGVPTVPIVMVQIPVRLDDDHGPALNNLTRLIGVLVGGRPCLTA